MFFTLPSIAINGQDTALPRVEPSQVGIPPSAITRLADSLMALPRTAIHSLIIMRHGKVAGEIYPYPFTKSDMHTMYSCSKTFVAAAVGIAIDEGYLSLESKVKDYFDVSNADSGNFSMMTVRDLLVMASGIKPDWEFRNVQNDWSRYWLSKPISQPGLRFQYDSMCTYLLSAILQKTTGISLLDFLKLRLFEPMGITEVEWEKSPEGFNTGGWGLHIRPESLAKFGQLLLDGGCWNGRQLVSKHWVGEMMKKQIDNGQQGYGYQMWKCEYPGAWRADGAFGQYIIVVPSKDMVVVITECSAIDGIRQRRLVYDVLLPEVHESVSSKVDNGNFAKRMSSYLLPFPATDDDKRFLTAGLAYTVPLNDLGWTEISLSPCQGGIVDFSYVQEGRRVSIPLEKRRWNVVTTPVAPVYSIKAVGRFSGIAPKFKVAGSYGVGKDGSIDIRLHYTNWITCLELSIANPESGNPTLSITQNFSNTPTVLNLGLKSIARDGI